VPTTIDDDGRRRRVPAYPHREQWDERLVDDPVVSAARTHVEVEDTRGDRGYYLAICGTRIYDGYRTRTGGLVTCQRCLRILATTPP